MRQLTQLTTVQLIHSFIIFRYFKSTCLAFAEKFQVEHTIKLLVLSKYHPLEEK